MTSNSPHPQDTLTDIFSATKDAYRKYRKELALLIGFFALTVTITNLAYGLFGFKLIQIFELTFDAFHAFCRLILYTLVFSWFTHVLEWLWYLLVWSCSLFVPVVPWRPEIVVPGWLSDLMLVSLALSRVFASADLIVPRHIRAKAEEDMTPELWSDMQTAQGRFWNPVHQFTHNVNARIWRSIDLIQAFLIRYIPGLTPHSTLVRRVLASLVAAVTFQGFIRLIGYMINVGLTQQLASPIVLVRRRLFLYFWISLLAAIAASATFLVMNGFLVEWMRQE